MTQCIGSGHGRPPKLSRCGTSLQCPIEPSTKLIYTVGMNSYLCPNNSCAGPNGTRFSASINNISFQFPTIDILQAYYYNISGVYGDKFPSVPELVFDFTTDIIPLEYQTPKNGTESTISVPTKGWATIRFEASNPGVWFMHCHVERHQTWGMDTAFIVKNGKHPEAQVLPPPSDMPHVKLQRINMPKISLNVCIIQLFV
ncbi:putative laccase-9 [Vitis vinifera]|uniref:Putative laccase-9 n=1 Tax=Vitis vinifera TaxID=29760 RepID=A0A438FDA3_VITVI|nr:putative laccase-9 [Vitis vinifera]